MQDLFSLVNMRNGTHCLVTYRKITIPSICLNVWPQHLTPRSLAQHKQAMKKTTPVHFLYRILINL